MITYCVIGAGWRSEFYLRIAKLLPELFCVKAVCVRNLNTASAFREKYDVAILNSLDDVLKVDCDFFVNCINKEDISDLSFDLCSRGYAVLQETPAVLPKKQILDSKNFKLQVAEQFHFMPRNQAYKKIIDSGILGEVHQVQLSCCHDYHAASLIRFFLDIKAETPTKTTISLPDKLTRYNCRAGHIEPAIVDSEEKITILNFGNKTAIYDFNFEQYFSDIRASRIVIRGTTGEIINNTCTYLKDGLPHSFEIKRNCFGAEESLDGFSLLKKIRNDGNALPVLFLTARDSIEDRVEGLDIGADDYLVKPFAFEELLARVRVLIRKNSVSKSSIICVGDLIVDISSRTVTKGGNILSLSAKEYELLQYLAVNKGIVLSREKIEDHIWNYDYEGGTNVVDVYIRYLRKKIDDNSDTKLIHTVRGMGYVLREEK